LQTNGQRVEALTLIDAQAPICTLNCEDDSLLFCIFASSLGFQFGKLIDITYEEASHLNEKEKLEYLEKKFEERGIFTRDIGDSYFRNSYRVYRAHFIAQYSKLYKPGKPLTVPAKLFRASDTFDLPEFQFDLKKLGINDPQKLKEMQSHRYLGWDDFLSQPPDVYDVPGDHYSIFREPNVRGLAEKLRETFAGLKKE
jgi:thioesterase domain-containing protein